MKKLCFLFFLIFSLCFGSAASANLIVNGSFEADPFTANGNYTLGLSGNDVTGWYIPSTDGTYPWGLQDGAFGAYTPYGDQFIVLGRYSTGVEYSIQQTISGLTPGDTYNLSFAIASEWGAGAEAEVSFLTGSSTASQVFSATNSGQYWTDWTIKTMDFLATGSTVVLQFKQTNPSSAHGYDLGLDNVIVEGAAPVPEPTTILLSGLGLLGMGAYIRRKKQAGK